MPLDDARKLAQALGIRSESAVRSIDSVLSNYARLTPQAPTTPVSGSIAASQVVSGTFADARIAESNVTQHEAALDILESQIADLQAYAVEISGTWTPTDSSGAGLTFDGTTAGYYVRLGILMAAFFRAGYPSTANSSDAQIGGLPVNVADTQQLRAGFVGFTDSGLTLSILPLNNSDDIRLYDTSGVRIQNSQLSTDAIFGCAMYLTSTPT